MGVLRPKESIRKEIDDGVQERKDTDAEMTAEEKKSPQRN